MTQHFNGVGSVTFSLIIFLEVLDVMSLMSRDVTSLDEVSDTLELCRLDQFCNSTISSLIIRLAHFVDIPAKISVENRM